MQTSDISAQSVTLHDFNRNGSFAFQIETKECCKADKADKKGKARQIHNKEARGGREGGRKRMTDDNSSLRSAVESILSVSLSSSSALFFCLTVCACACVCVGACVRRR
mmetsp:Transcript_25225/g.49278  ORF Transcript_25225/g.49278 Transcript_25225/m.49278 type:complete len:109 (-) Transcript_25225:567-893(-)